MEPSLAGEGPVELGHPATGDRPEGRPDAGERSAGEPDGRGFQPSNPAVSESEGGTATADARGRQLALTPTALGLSTTDGLPRRRTLGTPAPNRGQTVQSTPPA